MSDYDPSLDAIARTDRFVDALASGARMSSVDPLSAMLGGWRDEVRNKPDAHVITLAQASAALAQAQKPVRRNRVGLTVVGAAAAAVLCLGGFGAVVYDAAPGDSLYGLRSMLFGEGTKTRSDAVTLAAQELDQVQQLVNQGKWDEAQQKLVSLAPKVQGVDNTASKEQLVQQYNLLTAKVIERNPEATPPPPDAPPPPPNPQSPLSFLPVPVIEITTTSPSSINPNMMLSPSSSSSATSSSPLPTPSGIPTPLPTPSGIPTPLPTPSGIPTPLPTPSGSPKPTPLPTPSGPPKPTPSGIPTPLPTPSGPPKPTPNGLPSPTPSAPKPTPAAIPQPTPEAPKPTPAAIPQPTPEAPKPTPEAPIPTPAAAPQPTPSQAPGS
ncbi:MAG TPA: anti-sigma-D factor RsdA [Mycobacterium sp.]